MAWKQTIVTVPVNSSGPLIAANPKRFGLRWQNVGANPATVAPGIAAVVSGQGKTYAASAGENFLPREDTQDAFSVISPLGTTFAVWENVESGGALPAGSGA